jgi:hypothetical protein
MDQIKKAIERAKANVASPGVLVGDRLLEAKPVSGEDARQRAGKARAPALSVSHLHLERSRIVAHLPGTAVAMSFDLLRTRILQFMWSKGLSTLVVTSPTGTCGKTVTSINLAFSMARLESGHTVLVDLDLRKPQISNYLGIRPGSDIFGVLAGKTPLSEALVSLDVSGPRLSILPTLTSADRPSEMVASQEVKTLVRSLVKEFDKCIVVFDMPPLLFADDLISFLPNVDAVLLVVAAGQSTEDEVTESLRMIPEEKLAGLVLTKSDEKQRSSYYGYA